MKKQITGRPGEGLLLGKCTAKNQKVKREGLHSNHKQVKLSRSECMNQYFNDCCRVPEF